MAENKVPLLPKRKVYFDDCPGCRLAQRIESKPGIPYIEFLYVWLVTLCTALPISSLFPFLYFMIRDLHIAKREEDIGFYAGFVGASFMLGRSLTSVLWGLVADRYGRKPVIVFGIISVIIFNTLFGLSTSYWMAILTRFLLGALNGLLGPIKAYAAEVCRPEYQAIGVSLVSTAWGIGLVVGPAIGGFFAQPAENFPSIFAEDSLFGRFPYLLPCLIISIFAACVTITCIWLPETLHMHKESQNGYGTVEALEACSNGSDSKESNENPEGRQQAREESLLKNWPLMSSIIVYCVFSLYDMAFTEILPLWAESDRKFGGLNYSSQDVGVILAVSGFGLLVYQLSIYPLLEKTFGPIVLSRIGAALTIPLIASFPFLAMLSGAVLFVLINCGSLLKNIFSVSIITGLFILQNKAVPQHQRGAASGIAVASQSLFKAVAPAGAGAVFSWAQKRQQASFLPGDHMVFFFANVIVFIGFLMTFRPFLVPPNVDYTIIS
ncbi:protein ZINC INDUCED FACILITATOR-LIKE 1-like [Dioscorea cayenensis subsp. rotundata]|uniref:Protein ZINC INDUCED FACILITATOR-LIKE 1-like n=1 Tax=Dioscorea cayennensis subsp. rotundata TaxID=55577 RepID=A0AB40D308_DIOCR|nr:protein ZINC INDUCED FACILITATOR-LIKE 1-like [Dioscorea cayenensis subsp. rotundata]